jgi:hypothetical protein
MKTTMTTATSTGFQSFQTAADETAATHQRIASAVAAELSALLGRAVTVTVATGPSDWAEIRVGGQAGWMAQAVVPISLPVWQLRNKVEALLRATAGARC